MLKNSEESKRKQETWLKNEKHTVWGWSVAVGSSKAPASSKIQNSPSPDPEMCYEAINYLGAILLAGLLAIYIYIAQVPLTL